MPEYERAIQETARVTRHWCILHRTPMFSTLPTTFLSKQAYGVRMVELVFNETELLGLLAKYGLSLATEFSLGPHCLRGIAEAELIKMYVCKRLT